MPQSSLAAASLSCKFVPSTEWQHLLADFGSARTKDVLVAEDHSAAPYPELSAAASPYFEAGHFDSG